MKSICMAAMVVICASNHALSAGPTTILESATSPIVKLDNPVVLSRYQFEGCRFHISQPVLVSQIGGDIGGDTTSDPTLFGVIVSLQTPNGFPNLNPVDFEPLAVKKIALVCRTGINFSHSMYCSSQEIMRFCLVADASGRLGKVRFSVPFRNCASIIFPRRVSHFRFGWYMGGKLGAAQHAISSHWDRDSRADDDLSRCRRVGRSAYASPKTGPP